MAAVRGDKKRRGERKRKKGKKLDHEEKRRKD
jgi:hypothetical protein